MKKHFFFPALLLSLCLFSFSLSAQTGETNLLSAVEAYLNGLYPEARQELESLRRNTSGNSWEQQLLLSRIDLWEGRTLLAQGQETRAEELLMSAGDRGTNLQIQAGTAGISGKNSAQAFCLEADARAEIMLFKGVAYIIRNGSKVQDLAMKALELDPDNPGAGVIYAQGRINAPRLFGGNRTEGLSILYSLWERRPGGTSQPILSNPQAFRTAAALGDALGEKEAAKAAEFYRDALILYPGNPIIREKLDKLKK